MSDLHDALDRALAGGPERHHDKAREQGKLPVRERVARLLDDGSFAEEALLANWEGDGLGADGVVTGLGRIAGRPVAVMANDPTVKAGSWGPKTVEKIIRIQERALSLRVPMVYLVDSAGARITEQVQMFPGRRGAGKIFHTEVKLSGVVPQVCCCSARPRRWRLHPRLLRRRDHARRQRVDVPRSPAHGRDGHRREGDARGDGRRGMHTGVAAAATCWSRPTRRAIDLAKAYLSYLPSNWEEAPPAAPPAAPGSDTPIRDLIPADENKPFDIKALLASLVDADSFLEVHAALGQGVVVGYARLEGRVVGIVANQPKQKGGVLFVDSADKAARFIRPATRSTFRCSSWPTCPGS